MYCFLSLGFNLLSKFLISVLIDSDYDFCNIKFCVKPCLNIGNKNFNCALCIGPCAAVIIP